MGMKNQFNVLIDNDDPSRLITAAQKKADALPSWHPRPAQAGEFIRFPSNWIGSWGFSVCVLDLMRECGDFGLKCTTVVWDCCRYMLIWYSGGRGILLGAWLWPI